MLPSLLEVHFLCCFSVECQALTWKLDCYTSLSVATRITSTFPSSMCRKEFSVMGMSPRLFFTNKKASGNWKRAGETAWTARLCSCFHNKYSSSLKLPCWNQLGTVTFSHSSSPSSSIPDCSNAIFLCFQQVVAATLHCIKSSAANVTTIKRNNNMKKNL